MTGFLPLHSNAHRSRGRRQVARAWRSAGSCRFLRVGSGAVLALAIFLLASAFPSPAAEPEPRPIPESVRRTFNLAPFYQKYIEVSGLPVVGSATVSDNAVREAAWIVRQMLGNREDILRAMATNRVRLAVMAWNEFTTDIPEHHDLTPAVYWDRRARGLGATSARPAVSCAEENLLCHPGDPYATENICIHEFAHAIHGMGLKSVDPTFESRLREAYAAAKTKGLWKGTYAGTNPSEYWAEAVQDWFDDNRQNDSLHNQVNTRDELKQHDPALAALCAEVFGEGAWRYLKPALRPAAGRAHLVGYDPATLPRFGWREYPVVPKPRVLIQTAVGDIEVELDAEHTPVTAANFLRYVLNGFYSDGLFHRTVTLDNQPTNTVKIQVIQAQANPAKTNEFPAAIGLERTRDTGLRHREGTISMARGGPDTAQDHFFFCVTDQPELDFGGKRNPDGQGFAAFGQVIRGMDVVRQIHGSPAEGQNLAPPVPIQRAVRTR